MSFTVDHAATLVTANLVRDRDLYFDLSETADITEVANELMVIVNDVVRRAAHLEGEDPLHWWQAYLMLRARMP